MKDFYFPCFKLYIWYSVNTVFEIEIVKYSNRIFVEP